MRIWRSLTGMGVAALVLFCATAGWGAAHAAQQGTATIRAVPPSSSVAKSDKTVDVKIDVENVSNLGGFQFVLVVDSSVLKPTGALKTAFLGQTGREIYCPDPTIEDAAIRFACVTLREQPAGVDGSGTIANVSFKPVAKGATDLTLKEVQLVHPDGTVIASTAVDGRISVTGSSWWTRTHIVIVAAAAVVAVLIVLAVAVGVRLQLSRRAGPEPGADAGA